MDRFGAYGLNMIARCLSWDVIHPQCIFSNVGVMNQSTSPTVVFAMKYPDHEGNVWAWVTGLYDRVAMELGKQGISCLLAYPQLTDRPAVMTPNLPREKMDLVNIQGPQRETLVMEWLKRHRVKLVMFMDVEPSLANLKLLGRAGVRTINYAQYNFSVGQKPSVGKRWLQRIRGELGICHHDLYIAVSESNWQFLHESCGIPRRRLALLPNAVDTQRFSPGPKPDPASLGLPTTQGYALMVCQARPEKRIDFLIDVAAEVFRNRPDLPITFVYVGDGGERGKWETKANELGLQGRFVFAGQQRALTAYYRLADLFLHAPSRESFGLVVAEAMSCALPVIASKVGGPAEIVQHHQTGMLLEPDDTDGFTRAVIELWDNPELRRKMGQQGRQRVEQHYALEPLVENLKRQIMSLLG